MTSFRRLLPTILLLSGIAATATAAASVYRATRGHRAVMQRVLDEYAAFASWSYEQHLREDLRRAADELFMHVNHGSGVHVSPSTSTAAELGRFLPIDPACDCHRPLYGPAPEQLVAFEIGSDTVGLGGRLGADAHPHGGAPRGAEDLPRTGGETYRWVNEILTAHLRASPSTSPIYLLADRGAAPHLVSAVRMPTAWGDTIVYAAVYSPATLSGLLAGVLDRETLLPTLAGGLTNREVLNLDVTGPDGRVVFRSGTFAGRSALESRVQLPAAYGGLQVRSQIRPSVASALVVGGDPRSQMPLLVGLLLLATALTGVAIRQLAKQDQLVRERTDFLASVSHELRTPLAQLRLFLETIRLGRADTAEAQAWSLAQMDKESRRLVHLVDNVLAFSAGPSTLLAAPRSRVDLRVEIDEVASEFAPLASGRRATLETSGEHVEVDTSKDALRHVLLNLLDNAVKYGPVGQTVRLQVGLDAKGARIDVADEGPGVAESERARIWEAFYRGSSSGARAAGGSGIGLHLVREMVTRLGGEVAVANRPGGGAVFTVHLPLGGTL